MRGGDGAERGERFRGDDAGWSLPEALVALLLGLLVVHLGLDALGRLEAGRKRIAARTDALVALRVTRHVLRREVRHGVAGSDWALVGDSLSLRAFRGVGLVCVSDSTRVSVTVSYAGDRAPDPDKDSVLLISALGDAEVAALSAAAPTTTACPGQGSAGASEWLLDRPAPAATVAAKLFERGSYHLADAALRYRRGSSGRQPLTPEVWSAATRWTTSVGGVGVELVPLDSLAGPPWRGLVSWSGDP